MQCLPIHFFRHSPALKPQGFVFRFDKNTHRQAMPTRPNEIVRPWDIPNDIEYLLRFLQEVYSGRIKPFDQVPKRKM